MGAFGEDDIPLDHDTVEIPFIWIPDGYDGPRPGYPWFEAGRMTLSAEQMAAWPQSSRLSWQGEAGAGSGVTPADRQGERQTAEIGDMPEDAVVTSQTVRLEQSGSASVPPRSYGDAGARTMRAAIQAWDGLAKPHVTLAALDGMSESHSAAVSEPGPTLAGGGLGFGARQPSDPPVRPVSTL